MREVAKNEVSRYYSEVSLVKTALVFNDGLARRAYPPYEAPTDRATFAAAAAPCEVRGGLKVRARLCRWHSCGGGECLPPMTTHHARAGRWWSAFASEAAIIF